LFTAHQGHALPKSKTKTLDFRGLSERMMGLEATPVCMQRSTSAASAVACAGAPSAAAPVECCAAA
jgi:hypothetical protein